jgi:tRNA A37 threonylcarbamoyladenosine dehydratase
MKLDDYQIQIILAIRSSFSFLVSIEGRDVKGVISDQVSSSHSRSLEDLITTMMTAPSRNTLISFLIGASSALALTFLLEQQRQRKSKLQSKKSSSSSSSNATTAPATIPQHLREEQLSRHALYFGDMTPIRSAKVCVVGLGGVGSHTAIMLARGGVEFLRLIDFDQVTLSSLNRHACATLQDVGIPKVQCVQATCHALGVPHVDARVEMYTAANGPTLLEIGDDDTTNDKPKWDLVIDCIDDVPTKAALLAHCLGNGIRVLACMGAGGKSDMTRLHISDLRTAAKDPLASKLRQTLKKQMKDVEHNDTYLDDMDQLTIIYSSEKPVVKLADFTDEQKQERDKNQFGAVDGMRVRVLPVLGPMPAIMGQSLAAIALCELGKKPIEQPVTGERIGRNVRNKMYQHFQNREKRIATGQLVLKDEPVLTPGTLEIASDDVDYLMGVWRNRCAVTGARLGTVLSLARWDMSKPATSDNLVLMSTHALKAYDEKGRSNIPVDVQKRIEERLAMCRDLNMDI